MNIRRAEAGDARGIAGVHVRAWRAAYRGIVPDEVLNGLSVDDRERVWRGILADAGGPMGTIVVIGAEGGVEGFSCVSAPSRDEDAGAATAELTATYVDPDRWRRGTGTALVRGAWAELASRGRWRDVTLWVFRANEGARSFYGSLAAFTSAYDLRCGSPCASRPGGRARCACLRGRARLVPGARLTAASFLALQVVDGFENTRDHARGGIPGMLAGAGFSDIRLEGRLRTAWGSLELLSARA